MGLLANSTTQKAGLLNRVAQPVSVPPLPTVNANSTQQTTFDTNAPIQFSIAQPQEKPTYKLSGDTTISTAPKTKQTPLQDLVDKIPSGNVKDIVQGVVDAPRKLLFGSEQDRALIKELESKGINVPFAERFVAEGFMPTVGLSQGEVIDNKAQSLINKGVERNRAYDIASLDTLAKTVPKTPEEAKQRQIAQDQYDKLSITPDEKSTVRTSNFVHNLFAGLDIAGVLPVGATVENVGKGLIRIAGTEDTKVIATELLKMGVPAEKVPNLAEVLSKVKKPEVIHDLIQGALPESEKAGLLNRGATKEAPSIITDPARVQEVKNSIAEGENIIRSGSINGRVLSPEEIDQVVRSVDSAKAKIGLEANTEAPIARTIAESPKPETTVMDNVTKDVPVTEAPKVTPIENTTIKNPLIDEAKKYQTADEFINAQETKAGDYVGSHQAPTKAGDNAPAYDLTKLYPEDVYGTKAGRLYSSGYEEADKKAIKILHDIKGNPDAEITIYRTVPKDSKIKDINAGDWVTLTKDYATQHAESNIKGEYKLLQKKVKADEIYTDANSIQEFGYDPRKPSKEELQKIWSQAHESTKTTKNLYPTIHEGGVVKMVEGEPVNIVDGIDTFIHQGDGGWIVSEKSSGRFIAESKTKEGAIAKAKFNINEAGKEKVMELIDKNKLSSSEVKSTESIKPDTIPTEAPTDIAPNRRTPEEIAQRRAKLNERLKAIEDERKARLEKKDTHQFATIPKEVTSVEAKAEEYLSRVPKQYERDVLSLPDIVERSATDVKDKINIIDEYLRTPEHVMEKIGFGKEMKAIREGYDAYIKELPTNLEKITQWSKEVPKESNERIFKYLDGQEITLTKEEAKVAGEIKDWLKDWAKRLKLPEDNQISHYITHIFDKELINKEFDEDLAKIIADKIPSQVYDPFLLKRLGKQGYKQDTWQALDAYVKRATRKVNMDPALELVKDKAGSSLEFAKIEASQFNYLKEYIDRINMRPTELDNKIDNTIKSIFGYKYGTRPVTYLTKLLRQATSRGMLGLSPMSALRNLSQGANTYAKLGEKYTALGYMKLFSKGAVDELKETGVLADNFIQDRSINATKKAMEKIDKGLYSMFQSAEYINRGSAYFGAKAKGLAEGMSEKEAIDYAKKIVRDTQFTFGSIDTPIKLQSDIMKTMFQFQTFTVKQIEFLAGMMKNKEYAGLIRYLGSSLAFVYTVGQLFGMKPTDILPWFRFDVPPSLKLPTEIAKAGLDSPDKYGQPRDLSQKASDIAKAGIGLIPAGNQLKRIIDSLLLIQKGGSFDKGGNLQYEAPQTTEGKIQAILFGKTHSDEAQKYFNKSDLAQKEMDQIQPIYDHIQELKKSGKDQEAIDLYDSLGDKGKEVYKKIKSKVTAEATKQGKADILPTFQKIRKLKQEGKTQEALDMYDALDENQQKYYQLLKKQLDQKPDGTVSESSPIKDTLLSALGVEKASAMEVPPQKDEATQIKEATSSVYSQAEKIAPMIDKNYIKALVMQESSDGTDDSNRKNDQGKYGWLVGFTKPTYANIVNKAKTMKKYKNLLDSMSGFDTPEDAIKSALIYSQFLLRDHTKEQQTGKREWQDITATQLYKLYNGGGSPKGVVGFDKKFSDLSSQKELATTQ